MIGTNGAGNIRLVLGLAFFATAAILWLMRGSSAPLSANFSDWTDSFGQVVTGTVETEPRLNTTWHKQIALEMRTEKNGLKSVATRYGVVDRTRVALLSE